MRLQEVELNPNGFCCVCSDCGKTIGAMGRETEPRYADPDGACFSAYYCEDCAETVTK